MPPRITSQHALLAGLVVAATAVAASPAGARPIDRVDRYDNSTPRPYQDLRGEEAKDAARAHQPKFQLNQPTWPTHPAPVGKPQIHAVSPAPAPADGGSDDTWLILGIGLAATGVVAGSAAGAARHYRVRARRVAA